VLFESQSSGIVVRLCHFTVREYLSSPGVRERAEDFHIDLGQAHARIAEICLQYLSFSEFAVPLPNNPDAIVRELTSKYSTLGYAAMDWAVHLRESGITSAASNEFRQRILPRLSWFLHPERFPYTFRMWQYVVRYMVQYVVQGQFWYSDACFQSPLCFAIRMGLQPLVDIMLLELLDVNRPFSDGFTCLAVAAAGNHVSIAKQLLELGAKVDMLVQDRQLTPLHIAAENRCEGMVEFLLAAGASPAARSKSGSTPFYRGARGGSIRILTLLHESGSVVDAKTWDHWRPLMEAISRRHESAAKFLLEWGANPQACTARGLTALYLASGNLMSNIPSMLKASLENSIEERSPPEPASCPTEAPAAEFDKTPAPQTLLLFPVTMESRQVTWCF
jgi:hypothetical protein